MSYASGGPYHATMIHAYARMTDGQIREFDELDGLLHARNHGTTAVWLDVESIDEPLLRQIGAAFDLDPEAIDDCISGEQRPRIDEFADHIFIVLYGMLSADHAESYDPLKLAAFCSSSFLITVHGRRLRSVSHLRTRFKKQAATIMAKGVDFVLLTLIDQMVDNYIAVTETLEDTVEELEDAVLRPAVDDEVLHRAANLRRDLLEIRRLAMSQRELLVPLAEDEYDVISSRFEQDFRHVRDHLITVTELVDSLRERLTSVRDSFHSSITVRTNEIMKVLTLFATTMMPLTLVTSIYGMNLAVWPGEDQSWGFWAVLGVMGGVAAALLVYFRRKGWI